MQPPSSRAPDSAHGWQRYQPTENTPWNLRRVVHLHRRTGFAATWNEIERDLKDGPQASIDRVLAGKSATAGVAEEFESTASLLADSAVTSGDPARLKAWWLFRMLFSPDPLAERLTLLWHNHFATSNFKVNNLAFMHRQNELFRKLGRGGFGELLSAVVHDPAMLVWLDVPSNRKTHPNENLARELMELFTMGVGQFTEPDVKEAARALTGWSLENETFRHVPLRHDSGAKTILGKRDHWNGDDVVRIALEHPATARRLAWRIGQLLLGERASKTADLDALASGLRANNLNIGWAVETVVRSQAFFANQNLGDRVLSPVEFTVGAARALELFQPPPSTLMLAEWCTRLGEDLFYPPNVGGWPGGRSWLTARSLIGRVNFVTALLGGTRIGLDHPVNVLALAQHHGEKDVMRFTTRLLRGTEPSTALSQRIAVNAKPAAVDESAAARRTVEFILTQPEAQLA